MRLFTTQQIASAVLVYQAPRQNGAPKITSLHGEEKLLELSQRLEDVIFQGKAVPETRLSSVVLLRLPMCTKIRPSASLLPQVQQLISNILDAFITSSQVHYKWKSKWQPLTIAPNTVEIEGIHSWVGEATTEKLIHLPADVAQKSKKGAKWMMASATIYAMAQLTLRKFSLLSAVDGRYDTLEGVGNMCEPH